MRWGATILAVMAASFRYLLAKAELDRALVRAG
jgi:hypothetical protein